MTPRREDGRHPTPLRCLAWLVSPDPASGAVVAPHAFGGVALFARALAPHLPDDAALLVLQSSGLSGSEPDTTLDAMAQRYVAELRRAAPPRPVVTVGFCMGTSIALAMAASAPDLVDAVVLVDPGPHEPSGDDHVATFAFDQLPEGHRPPWEEFRQADRARRVGWLCDVFVRKGVGATAAAELVEPMYRVWEANAGCAPRRDLDAVPEQVSITLATDDATDVRGRFTGERPATVVALPPRRGERFDELDLPTLGTAVRELLAREDGHGSASR